MAWKARVTIAIDEPGKEHVYGCGSEGKRGKQREQNGDRRGNAKKERKRKDLDNGISSDWHKLKSG